MHSGVHPSPPTRFPSSQSSPASGTPSPQEGKRHEVRHASGVLSLLSAPESHCSSGSTRPFPQDGSSILALAALLERMQVTTRDKAWRKPTPFRGDGRDKKQRPGSGFNQSANSQSSMIRYLHDHLRTVFHHVCTQHLGTTPMRRIPEHPSVMRFNSVSGW